MIVFVYLKKLHQIYTRSVMRHGTIDYLITPLTKEQWVWPLRSRFIYAFHSFRAVQQTGNTNTPLLSQLNNIGAVKSFWSRY